MAAKLDPDLDVENANAGADEVEGAGRVVDTEKTGGRHRRRYGYTTEGAAENDHDISLKGRKPLKITMHKQSMPESRIANFGHGMATHHIDTVKPKQKLTIIK
jgi:hypothetical protein